MDYMEGGFEGVGGASVYYRLWQPSEKPSGLMILAHGLAEHCGRYHHVAEYFCQRGYVVAALDHPGHGQSSGQRCYIDTFDDFVETLELFRRHLCHWFSSLPVVLTGHSMGGLIAARYAHRYQKHLAALVLSGPAFKPVYEPAKALVMFIRTLSWLFPRLGVVQLEPDAICRDPAVVVDYLQDELVWKGKMSARLAVELFENMALAQLSADELPMPVMIVQGGDDRLTAPEGAQSFFESLPGDGNVLKIYPGLFHEVFNEPEHDQVLADVWSWLSALMQSVGDRG